MNLSSMSYHRGTDRHQIELLPASIEQYVHDQAPVRVIDAFVDDLDLVVLKFTKATPASTGRPAYHPGDLLKLYLYGYLHRIRSSRRLEAECSRNLEVMWLLRQQRPDFKTIADFRKDNIKSFKGVLREFNLLCRKLHLFGAELMAIDGTKFKAQNSNERNTSAEKLRELIKRIDTHIETYVGELDRADRTGEGTQPATRPDAELEQKLKDLRQKRGECQRIIESMQAAQQTEVSHTDADARKMKNAREGGYFIGYNMQAAVDVKHDLIVAVEAEQKANDRSSLCNISQAGKTELGCTQIEVVADKGYHSGAELAKCEDHGIITYVPAQANHGGRSSKEDVKVFGKEDFRYDAEKDVYHCPAGQQLRACGMTKRKGSLEGLNYRNKEACRECALRAQCIRGGRRREIRRRENDGAIERAAARLASAGKKYEQRRNSVEHVFGTLKAWGHRELLLKGLVKVSGEMNLSAMSYNLRRVINILGVEEMLKAIKEQKARRNAA